MKSRICIGSKAICCLSCVTFSAMKVAQVSAMTYCLCFAICELFCLHVYNISPLIWLSFGMFLLIVLGTTNFTSNPVENKGEFGGTCRSVASSLFLVRMTSSCSLTSCEVELPFCVFLMGWVFVGPLMVNA